MRCLCGKHFWHRIWDELIAYRTDRFLEVEDSRLGLLHKLCLIGAALYLMYTVVASHSYMKKETPNVSVNSWVEGTQQYRELQDRFQKDPSTLPWYCDSSSTDYVYSDNFKYLNNTCDTEIFMGEATISDSNAIQFVTYYQDRPEVNPEHNLGVNAFVPEIEQLYLVFSHSFSTSIGIKGTNVETTFRSVSGQMEKHFPAGKPVKIQISELLQLASVNLNDRNKNSGGLPPEGDMKWPLYRMTGVALPLELTYENFRTSNPFDFSVRLKVEVASPKNAWMGSSQETFAKWQGDTFSSYERFSEVVSVSFDTAGTVGAARAFEAIISLAVSAAVFGVVKAVMDVIGTAVVKEFFAMKVVDQQDRHNLHLAAERGRIYARKAEGPQKRREKRMTEFTTINPITEDISGPSPMVEQKALC
eukprot:gb/GECG01014168.1/.p1 GENE.gb/GECG01014168.1/~~gb/GECG01014168.1/.p1  ORF type:complete len:417 (+),score=46.29 gb/GECG01014168.1/:1-1251(+)